MVPSSVIERFEQIDAVASRARALVAVLILHFTTADRHSELGDEYMTGVLETLEDQLDQVRAQARTPSTIPSM